ncbi:MAG TPA: hypothetical protein VGJ26_08005 [Pirellulales bacterium]|jgi:hypothetical protein
MLNLAFVPLLGVGTDLWYGLPLIVAISLVYSGTRHEQNDQILVGALRTGTWILGFMVAIFAVLGLMSWNL